HPPELHSFPTRRSSDLLAARQPVQGSATSPWSSKSAPRRESAKRTEETAGQVGRRSVRSARSAPTRTLARVGRKSPTLPHVRSVSAPAGCAAAATASIVPRNPALDPIAAGSYHRDAPADYPAQSRARDT